MTLGVMLLIKEKYLASSLSILNARDFVCQIDQEHSPLWESLNYLRLNSQTEDILQLSGHKAWVIFWAVTWQPFQPRRKPCLEATHRCTSAAKQKSLPENLKENVILKVIFVRGTKDATNSV